MPKDVDEEMVAEMNEKDKVAVSEIVDYFRLDKLTGELTPPSADE